jgi:hypothetical protein
MSSLMSQSAAPRSVRFREEVRQYRVAWEVLPLVCHGARGGATPPGFQLDLFHWHDHSGAFPGRRCLRCKTSLTVLLDLALWLAEPACLDDVNLDTPCTIRIRFASKSVADGLVCVSLDCQCEHGVRPGPTCYGAMERRLAEVGATRMS